MSEHTCHAEGCKVPVPRRMFMCGRHWAMVPKALQDALWAAYTPGQENNWDRIKDEYWDAAFAVQNHVRALESATS